MYLISISVSPFNRLLSLSFYKDSYYKG